MRSGPGHLALALTVVATALAQPARAGPPAPAGAPPAVRQADLPDPNAPEPAAPPAAAATTAPAPVPTVADAASAARGQRLYKDFCQRCHGIEMVSAGPPFFDLRTFPHDQKERFVDAVSHGKRAMPAWGAILKPAEIDALWAYVASYRPPR